MADITKCANKNCKIKDMCYRYNARDGYFQSYADFNNGKVIKEKSECKHFYIYKKRREKQ